MGVVLCIARNPGVARLPALNFFHCYGQTQGMVVLINRVECDKLSKEETFFYTNEVLPETASFRVTFAPIRYG